MVNLQTPADPDTLRRLRDLAVTREREGNLKLTLFYGHKAPLDVTRDRRPIGPWVLSQWWTGHPIRTPDDCTYPTAEHWMMACKAVTFGDQEALAAILAARTPADAKALGREVRGFDPQLWERRRWNIVRTGNMIKFGQHPELLDYLLSTRGTLLAEASPRDRIWGIGLAATHPDATRPSRWRGQNLLGYALTDVREYLHRHAAELGLR